MLDMPETRWGQLGGSQLPRAPNRRAQKGRPAFYKANSATSPAHRAVGCCKGGGQVLWLPELQLGMA